MQSRRIGLMSTQRIALGVGKPLSSLSVVLCGPRSGGLSAGTGELADQCANLRAAIRSGNDWRSDWRSDHLNRSSLLHRAMDIQFRLRLRQLTLTFSELIFQRQQCLLKAFDRVETGSGISPMFIAFLMIFKAFIRKYLLTLTE